LKDYFQVYLITEYNPQFGILIYKSCSIGYPSSQVEASKKSNDAVVPINESSSDGFSIDRYEPIVPTLEMQQDKALELENNDKYWSKRFEQFEAELLKTNQIMDKEYKSAVRSKIDCNFKKTHTQNHYITYL
jgi:hypothetical protein